MTDRRRISPKELALKGWTRTTPPGEFCRAFRHTDGWIIEHCGHPTALYPYLLYDPKGEVILAPSGRAWPTIAMAVDYVASR